jgi:hypothetical protein
VQFAQAQVSAPSRNSRIAWSGEGEFKMRGKDFNTGLRGVLFEATHYERMGSALWLYGWLVLRQTHQTGSTGWVLGGAAISYKEIEEETGFNARTLERWMGTLRREGYVETESAMGGLIVRITKAKKHVRAARNFGAAAASETPRRAAEGIRKLAGDPRNFAEGYTQTCGAKRSQAPENMQVSAPICSSFLEESIKNDQSRAETQEQNPSCSSEIQNQTPKPVPENLGGVFFEAGRRPNVKVQAPQQPWLSLAETRLQLELLRAEREEAVRRELRVGRGPEVVPRKQAFPANEK